MAAIITSRMKNWKKTLRALYSALIVLATRYHFKCINIYQTVMIMKTITRTRDWFFSEVSVTWCNAISEKERQSRKTILYIFSLERIVQNDSCLCRCRCSVFAGRGLFSLVIISVSIDICIHRASACFKRNILAKQQKRHFSKKSHLDVEFFLCHRNIFEPSKAGSVFQKQR